MDRENSHLSRTIPEARATRTTRVTDDVPGISPTARGHADPSVGSMPVPEPRSALRPAPEPVSRAGPRTAAPPEVPQGTLRILLVEDNPDAAETMLEVLEDWGYTVHLCPDGPAALSAVQDASPDVVLMDIGLPGMDGYEVARRLRGLPALAAARFMALTGYGQESDRVHSREAGFDAHLVKPVDLACLRRLLAAATRPMA